MIDEKLSRKLLENYCGHLDEIRERVRFARGIIKSTEQEHISIEFDDGDLKVLLFAFESILDDEED